MARHVPHLLVPGEWTGSELTLTSEQSSHLRRVLRREPGSPVDYTDGRGRTGSGTLVGSGILRGEESAVDRPVGPTLAVAAPAEKDRARFLVEKLAELGVRRLVWLSTRHGEGRPPSDSKVEAWCRAALEQSRAAWLMDVDPDPVEIGDLPPDTVFADRDGEPGALDRPDRWIAVGPAGGWADGEIPTDAPRVALGAGILRVETAAVAAAAVAIASRPFPRPL